LCTYIQHQRRNTFWVERLFMGVAQVRYNHTTAVHIRTSLYYSRIANVRPPSIQWTVLCKFLQTSAMRLQYDLLETVAVDFVYIRAGKYHTTERSLQTCRERRERLVLIFAKQSWRRAGNMNASWTKTYFVPTPTLGDFTFWLSLSLSQFAERNLKLNAKVPT